MSEADFRAFLIEKRKRRDRIIADGDATVWTPTSPLYMPAITGNGHHVVKGNMYQLAIGERDHMGENFVLAMGEDRMLAIVTEWLKQLQDNRKRERARDA